MRRLLLAWPGLITIALVAPAHAARPPDFSVLDVDFERGLVLVEERFPPVGSADRPRCRNTFLGGRGLALVVHAMAGTPPRRFDLAGFPEKGRCPTPQSVEQARAAATTAVAALGLTIGPALAIRPFDGTADLTAVEQRVEHAEVMHLDILRTLRRGGVSMAGTSHTEVLANQLEMNMDSWLVEQDGQAAVVHRTVIETMRTIDITLAVDGPLRSTGHVDVAGLTAVAASLPDGCAISVVAPAGRLQRTVAVTVRDALRGSARAEVGPAKAARAPRATSTVYGAPACQGAAKAVAALIPGGADSAPLTWDARGGIVVALGDSAAATTPSPTPSPSPSASPLVTP